jgi:hypothetical protein
MAAAVFEPIAARSSDMEKPRQQHIGNHKAPGAETSEAGGVG